MYRGRHHSERLFRPTSRASVLAARVSVVGARVGAVVVRDRHLPARTGRRAAVGLTLVLGILAAPVLVPVSAHGPTRVRANTVPADPATEAPSSPEHLGPPAAATPARPPAPRLRQPMPATPLMASAPSLPRERDRAGRALLLTFDDGPDPRWTPKVLELLAAYRARAVFCVVGREAQQHPELVRAIVAGGHELCNHTMHHDDDLALAPGAVVRADLAATQQILRGITGGVVPRYVRAPGGRWSPTLVGEAQVLGLAPLDWSVDPRDWSRPGLRHIVDTVLDEAAPGGVVVLHDGGGDRTQTLLALGFLLRRLRRLGYTFR